MEPGSVGLGGDPASEALCYVNSVNPSFAGLIEIIAKPNVFDAVRTPDLNFVDAGNNFYAFGDLL